MNEILRFYDEKRSITQMVKRPFAYCAILEEKSNICWGSMDIEGQPPRFRLQVYPGFQQ